MVWLWCGGEGWRRREGDVWCGVCVERVVLGGYGNVHVAGMRSTNRPSNIRATLTDILHNRKDQLVSLGTTVHPASTVYHGTLGTIYGRGRTHRYRGGALWYRRNRSTTTLAEHWDLDSHVCKSVASKRI